MSEAVPHQRGAAGSSMIVGASIAAWSIGAFVYYLVAGRLLGPDAYGLVAALQSVIIVVSLPVIALQWSTARTIAAATPDERPSALATYRRALVRSSLAICLLAVIAGGITIAIDAAGTPLPVWPLLITYVSIIGLVPLVVACGALQGEHRYAGLAWSYASSGVLRAPLLLLLVLLPWSTTDASLLAVAGAIAIGAAWAVWLTRDDLRVRRPPEPGMWRRYSRSLPAVMTGLMGIAALTNVDVIAAKLALGGDDAGLFGAASVVAKALLVVPQALALVLLPRVAERDARDEPTGPLLAMGIIVMIAAGGIAMLIAEALAEPIMTIAFGSQYADAASLLVPFFGATTLLGALLLLVNHHVARSDHRFVWAVAGLAVLQVVLLAFLSTSSMMIIAIDAIVAGIGLVMHEVIYFNSDQSMLRGAATEIGRMGRRMRGAARER
jgi:O-antigen/teichoic acid export membrane protein